MIKTLPQTSFEDFAVCIMLHNSLLVLPIFKTLSTCKHQLTVHQQSSMAQLEVQNSWHCTLALSPLPFPPHTSRALLGLALTWPQAGHSVGSTASLTPLFSTVPGCALPQTPLQHPRLSNRERSGARFKGTQLKS